MVVVVDGARVRCIGIGLGVHVQLESELLGPVISGDPPGGEPSRVGEYNIKAGFAIYWVP